MKTSISEAIVSVFGILVCLQIVEGCSVPVSLIDYECPEYRLIKSYGVSEYMSLFIIYLFFNKIVSVEANNVLN